jgi:short subunit dehydrogenase-like uncharacterized protein
MKREFDVVLYGATGFTGRQTVDYFLSNAPANLRWAIAGRNAQKLAALAESLSRAPAGIIVADGTDAPAVDGMCQRTRVLLTTAGPFNRYGREVLAGCVRHQVHYVDITGETPFARDMIDLHHTQAVQTGTRIIPFSGFDSVPSDLGVYLTVKALREAYGQTCRRVSASFKMKGGLNGGTVASGMDMATSGRVRELEDVLLLNPPTHRSDEERARSTEFKRPRYDTLRQTWLTPFVMAPINTRVVRRSNALFAQLGEAYGDQFAYEESLEVSRRIKAHVIARGSLVGESMMRSRLGRKIVGWATPKPGQGPSEAVMDGGFFRVRLVGTAEDGREIMLTLSSAGDPGNRVTVKILCESALALALDSDVLPGGPSRGGILTPATGLGEVLVSRLKAVGFTMETQMI